MTASQIELFADAARDDWLGDAYCRDNDAAARREHGITLTPTWLVHAMLDSLGSGRFDNVVDCGAGTGRFALAAAVRWPHAKVIAVESHPALAVLLRQRVFEAGLSSRITVVEQDFREFVPPSLGRTLYLGNPPYVRHHDIEATWKSWYADGMAAYGIRASQLAGLHAHFVLAAAQRMRHRDALCFVSAAEWLDNGYGDALRRLFTTSNGPRLRALWLADASQPLFIDALVSSVVFIAESDDGAPHADLGAISAQRFATTQALAHEALAAAPRWSGLCRSRAVNNAAGVEVGELFKVVRGQVTGANEVFVLPTQQQELPPELTCAAVTRAREIIDGQVLRKDGVLRLKCVANLPPDLDMLDTNARRAALRFIESARKQGADLGYVARSRKSWFAVAMRRPPAAFVSYMGRRPPVFALNPWGVSYLNIAHGLYPRVPLAPDVLARVLAHLNTSTDIGSGRVYGGGLAKFEPSDVSRLRLPRELFEGVQ